MDSLQKNDTNELFRFVIPGKPKYLQMVRLAIASIADEGMFDVDAVEDIKISLTEACKLISCHGHLGFCNFYEINCNLHGGKIEIAVTDSCNEYSLEKDVRPCINCPDDGNLSLVVIESLMDRVEDKKDADGRRTIVMVKSI